MACSPGRGVGGLGKNWVDEVSVNKEDGLFLKMLTEGAITTEAESLFQYETTLTENADNRL